MLDVAGGDNVFDDVKRESTQPSIETLLARAPDAILEVHAATAAGDYASKDLGVWAKLASVPAVRQGRVHEVIGDFVVVAGPRLVEGADAIARALHPDAFQ
jgi:ABC-type Fe3+-hydroxamate transport system substrate-binding protein